MKFSFSLLQLAAISPCTSLVFMHGQLFPHRSLSIISTFLCLLMLSGCAISKQESGVSFAWQKPRWGNLFASKQKKTSEEKAVANVVQKAEVEAASTANPFQEKKSRSEIKLASSSQNADWEQFTAIENPSGLDPATLMLIQTEFENVPAAERKKWYEELRQVPPGMIPQILRMRRLAQKSLDESSIPNRTPLKTRTSLKLASNSQQDRYESANELPGGRPWEDRSTSGERRPLGESRELPWNSSGQNKNSAHPIDVAQKQDLTVPPPLTTPETNLLESLVNPQSGHHEFQKTLDQFIAVAERRVASLRQSDDEKQKQEFIASHAYLRMLYLMANRQERALEAIPNIPPADQEFWQQMFWAMSNYFDAEGIPNSSDRATHTISQLSEAMGRLRQRANLELRNVLFCTKIDGFGTYDRFERSEFSPGQPVLIYAEARNFLSSPTANGQYKTVLKSTIEIHRAGSQGGVISKQEFPPTEDFCKNRRTDYFHSYLLNIPKDLPAGPYVLKLIVEDQLNRKVASYMVNFSII